MRVCNNIHCFGEPSWYLNVIKLFQGVHGERLSVLFVIAKCHNKVVDCSIRVSWSSTQIFFIYDCRQSEGDGKYFGLEIKLLLWGQCTLFALWNSIYPRHWWEMTKTVWCHPREIKPVTLYSGFLVIQILVFLNNDKSWSPHIYVPVELCWNTPSNITCTFSKCLTE